MIYNFIYGTKHQWDELAVGRTCNATKHPGTKHPGTNLHWDETTINHFPNLTMAKCMKSALLFWGVDLIDNKTFGI